MPVKEYYRSGMFAPASLSRSDAAVGAADDGDGLRDDARGAVGHDAVAETTVANLVLARVGEEFLRVFSIILILCFS